MVVAENRLSSELVQEGLNTHATDWPKSMLYYQDARGIQELRTTLAHMVQRTFMKVCMCHTGSSTTTVVTAVQDRCRCQHSMPVLHACNDSAQ